MRVEFVVDPCPELSVPRTNSPHPPSPGPWSQGGRGEGGGSPGPRSWSWAPPPQRSSSLGPPNPITRNDLHYLHDFLCLFFIIFSITFFYPKRYRNIPQRAPKSHQTAPQNHQKSSPANSLGKTSKKSGKTLAPSCPSGRPHMQSAHACAVQTQFSILSPRPKKQKQKLKLPPKNIKKSSKILPKSTPEPIKKRAQKKGAKSHPKHQKHKKTGPKLEPNRGGTSPRIPSFSHLGRHGAPNGRPELKKVTRGTQSHQNGAQSLQNSSKMDAKNHQNGATTQEKTIQKNTEKSASILSFS